MGQVPMQVKLIHEDVKMDGTEEATWPHKKLEADGVNNALVACIFDYYRKGVHHQYAHCLNLKRDPKHDNNWAICDSSLPKVYYIERRDNKDLIDLQKFYGLIKLYSIYTLVPKDLKN